MASWGDEQIDLAMGRVLRTGVVLASVVMLIGAVLYLLRHGTELPEYSVFRGTAPELRTLPGVIAAMPTLLAPQTKMRKAIPTCAKARPNLAGADGSSPRRPSQFHSAAKRGPRSTM